MRRGGRAVRVAARALLVVVFLAPVAFMVLGSLQSPGGAPTRGVPVVPEGLESYRELARRIPLGALLRSSALVTFVAVPVTVLLASWAGFAIAQLGERARRRALAFAVVLLLLPVPVTWVPRFAAYVRLGVLDTYVPLVAPALAATTPFTVLLAYRAFRRVPPELFQAARLEGASALWTWWRVGLPLVRSTTTAIAAIAFAFHWGNYLDALLYVQSRSEQTLPPGVGELAQLDSGQQPVLLAGAVLLALPPLLVLAAAQRRLLAAVDVAAER